MKRETTEFSSAPDDDPGMYDAASLELELHISTRSGSCSRCSARLNVSQ